MLNLALYRLRSSHYCCILGLIIGGLIYSPNPLLAHGGHGDEFKPASVQSSGSVSVDPATAQRLGLKVEPVLRQRLAFGVKTTGTIEILPNRQAEVTTPVGGTLLRLLVKPGDRVTVGQPVAIMNSPELADLRTTAMDRRAEAIAAVQTATADVQLAQENLVRQSRIADQEVREAQSALRFATESYSKDQSLAREGALPRRVALESGTKLAAAQAGLSKATSRLSVLDATGQLKHSQVALEAANTRLTLSGSSYQARLKQVGANANEDGTVMIVAPIAGTVSDRESTVGESAKDPGKKILSIVNGSTIQVTSNIFEKDLSQIHIGQSARIQVSSLPKRIFNGRIRMVGTTVNRETHVVPVTLELENSDGALKPGMFAEIEVLTDLTSAAVLLIPTSAIVETNDKKKIVFVQNGSEFQSADITVGRSSGDLIEIMNGLLDGDRVVTQRAPQLYTQSLRGDPKPVAVAEPKAVSELSKGGKLTLPTWAIGLAVGLLIPGVFWAGTAWSSHRNQRFQLIENQIIPPYNPDINLDPSAALRIEEPQQHHDSN
jgi:membrane fusion protein, heavy metal efflux system